MNKKILPTHVQRIVSVLSSLFLNGLLTILPLTLTIAIIMFCLRLLKGWLAPLKCLVPSFLLSIPHAEIILSILFILLVGAILKFFILRSLIHGFERIIAQVPLLRHIYAGIKQLVHAFNPQDTLSFKQVVLIQFPRAGTYSIGFVTSEVPLAIAPNTTDQFVCVFVPTTPNPTTGFFMFVTRPDVTPIDLTRQEAMALIISGGIIQPERFNTTPEHTCT